MTRHLHIEKNDIAEQVPVRRRNQSGSETENISVSVPKELAQRINNIVVKTKQSRSLVITELLQEAFNARKEK